MKNQNQVRLNTKRASASAQQKPQSRSRIRIRVHVPEPLKRLIKKGAKRLNITVPQFVERAIRERLNQIEAALLAPAQSSRRGSDSRPPYHAGKISLTRFVTIDLTEMQWLQMEATHSEGSIKQFLATATQAQLLKIRHATPVAFDFSPRCKPRGKSPMRFVFVQNLKRSEATGDWAHLKSQRRLVVSALKLRGIIPSTMP